MTKQFVLEATGNTWHGLLYFHDLPKLKRIKEAHFKTKRGRFTYIADPKSATVYDTITDAKAAIKRYDLHTFTQLNIKEVSNG